MVNKTSVSKTRTPKKNTEIWITREGVEVRVCDMSDIHLKNTIRYVQQNVMRVRGGTDPDDFWCEERDDTDHYVYDIFMSYNAGLHYKGGIDYGTRIMGIHLADAFTRSRAGHGF